MRKERRMIGLALCLALVLAAFGAAAEGAVHGNVSGWTWTQYGTQAQGVCLGDRLDIDGDGVEEYVYFDQYGDREYSILQFVPDPALVAGGAADIGAYIHLTPGVHYVNGDGLSNGTFADGLDTWDMEYLNAAFLGEADGLVYACVTACVRGANGVPEVYPEFFRLAEGEVAFAPMETSYRELLPARWEGVPLTALTGVTCRYHEGLGRWALVLEQYADATWGEPHYGECLETWCALEGGALTVLEQRYVAAE